MVIETEALKTGKTLELQAPPLHIEVDAERRYLHRVVQNLMGNAVRYCDNRVVVSGGLDEFGNAYVCVEDDGPGIPPEQRNKIFDAFHRLDPSRDRATGGFGLGLAIVRGIMQAHQGSAAVEASSLGGASFICRWPHTEH